MKIKVEFEFDTEGEQVTPVEGAAVLYAYVEGHEEPAVLYGNMNNPSTLSVIGLYSVGLDDAKLQFSSGGELGE